MDRRRARALPDGERLVLLIDQFEEAFVACRDQAEREAFFDAWSRAPVTPTSGWSSCSRSAATSTRAAPSTPSSRPGQRQPAPGRADAPRRAAPGDRASARRAGLRVEPRLVSALVGDVAEEPGGLPLLSAALVELWQRREGRTLRYEVYERSGGVSGAVARLAEDAYQRLSPAERLRARPMLLRLAGADDEQAEGSSAAAFPSTSSSSTATRAPPGPSPC